MAGSIYRKGTRYNEFMNHGIGVPDKLGVHALVLPQPSVAEPAVSDTILWSPRTSKAASHTGVEARIPIGSEMEEPLVVMTPLFGRKPQSHPGGSADRWFAIGSGGSMKLNGLGPVVGTVEEYEYIEE